MKRTLCAALLATACLTLASCGHNHHDDMDNKTDAIGNIMTRTSIRVFKPTKLTDSQMETLLRAGMSAPTAVNSQPWEFVVVDDAALLDSLQAALPNVRISNGCRQVIVVCGNEERMLDGEGKGYWLQDCSAATQNILLAAHATGLGAVWCGVAPIKERMDKLADILKVPDNIMPFCVICVGEPDESSAPKDKWRPDRVHRNANW
ncbi:MAG: nitroreductase family protein [Marinilabiliaceae bacterium]